MNCNCVSNMEKKMAEYHKPLAGENAKAVCVATAFGLTDKGMHLAIVLPFRVEGDKKGFNSAKGKIVNMHASFCPFCGVSTKPEAAAA